MIKGLPNIGNSCYFNSSIQLCKLIKNIEFQDSNCTENSFIRDIQNLFENNDEISNYLKLYTYISSKLQYQQLSQQDSSEVVQFIVDKFVDLISDKNKLLSIFNQIIFCSNCSYYRICNEQKESMLISHELNNSSSDTIEFLDFFKNIISIQNIDNLNTECKCDSPKAQIQTIFTSLPEYLFINVGRCDYTTRKIYKKLLFNSDFNIDNPIHLENSIKGIDIRKKNNHYILIGIIIHHGETSNSGHYSSIIKHNEEWIYCDDLRIVKIDINNEMEYIQKNCCVLLYKNVTY